MKVEVHVDGRAAKLEVDAGRFRYEREGSEAIEREYSIAPLAPGSYSVLIGGRSYAVIAAGPEIRVNGRLFPVEVFDPREMRGRKSGGVGKSFDGAVQILVGLSVICHPGRHQRQNISQIEKIRRLEPGSGLGKFEDKEPAARAQHPADLGQATASIGHVAQTEGQGHGIESALGEGKVESVAE